MLEIMKQQGAFSWNELMTTDIDGAKKFYKQLFDWELQDLESDQPYTMATISTEKVAGLMPMPPEAPKMPARWGAYVTVNNIEESMNQAKKLGGQVLLEPEDIPNVGRICVLADPQGATFTIISYFENS